MLCDRFPLSEIRSMDGSRTRGLSAASHSWAARWLLRLEKRYYAAIRSPDLLLILNVRPELALQRRPEDPPERIRQRAREIREVDWNASGALVVDADRPMNDVHRELKSWIWARL